MKRPENRTITIGAYISNIDRRWHDDLLDVFESWEVSKFEPLSTLDGEWTETWVEVTIVTKRIDWDDYGEDILAYGWKVV